MWLCLLEEAIGYEATQPPSPIILGLFTDGGTAEEWAGARAAVRDLTAGGGLPGMTGVVLRAAAPAPDTSITQLLGGALSEHAAGGNRVVGIAAPSHTSTAQGRGKQPWQVLLFPQRGSPPRPLSLPAHLPTHLRSYSSAPDVAPAISIADDAFAARRLALTLTGENCSCATTNVVCTATPISATWAVTVLVILLVLLALAVVGFIAARRAGIILLRRGGGGGRGGGERWQRQRETETETERQRETERDRERWQRQREMAETERERDGRDRERESARAGEERVVGGRESPVPWHVYVLRFMVPYESRVGHYQLPRTRSFVGVPF